MASDPVKVSQAPFALIAREMRNSRAFMEKVDKDLYFHVAISVDVGEDPPSDSDSLETALTDLFQQVHEAFPVLKFDVMVTAPRAASGSWDVV